MNAGEGGERVGDVTLGLFVWRPVKLVTKNGKIGNDGVVDVQGRPRGYSLRSRDGGFLVRLEGRRCEVETLEAELKVLRGRVGSTGSIGDGLDILGKLLKVWWMGG